MGTDNGFQFSETRFSSDRTVVFEDNDEGYGSTRITFTAMYKDDVNNPSVDVRDVGSNDSLSRIIDDCFNSKYKESLNLPRYVKSCRIDSDINSVATTNRTPVASTSKSPVSENGTSVDPVSTSELSNNSVCTIRTPVPDDPVCVTPLNSTCVTVTPVDVECTTRKPSDQCWRSHTIQVADDTDRRTDAGSTRATSGGLLAGSVGIPWRERKTNIDNALLWLRSELEGMRVQDKLLLSQLQRCRETIDSLKQQRCSWDEGSDDGDLDEEEEDHWEDWEIAEYERKYAANREYSFDSEDSREKSGRDISESSSSRNSRDCLENLSSRNSIDSTETATERPHHTGSQCVDRMSRRSQSTESASSSAGSLFERRVARKYSETSSSGSTKGVYFRQDIEVTV